MSKHSFRGHNHHDFEIINIGAGGAGADDIPETQPVCFARAKAPPALLLHGANDKIVRPHNSERLAQCLRAAGSRVEEKFYSGFKHMRIIVLMASPLQGDDPLMEDIETFINANK